MTALNGPIVELMQRSLVAANLEELRRGLGGAGIFSIGDADLLLTHRILEKGNGAGFLKLTEEGAAFVAEAMATKRGTPWLVDGYSVDDVVEGSPAFLRLEKQRRSIPVVVVVVDRFPNGWIRGVDFEIEKRVGDDVGPSTRRERGRAVLSRRGDLVVRATSGGLTGVLRIGRIEIADPPAHPLSWGPAMTVIVDGVELPGVAGVAEIEPGRLAVHRRIDPAAVDVDPGIEAFHARHPWIRALEVSADHGDGPITVTEEWTISRHTPIRGGRVLAVTVGNPEGPPAYVRPGSDALDDPDVVDVVDGGPADPAHPALSLFARRFP